MHSFINTGKLVNWCLLLFVQPPITPTLNESISPHLDDDKMRCDEKDLLGRVGIEGCNLEVHIGALILLPSIGLTIDAH